MNKKVSSGIVLAIIILMIATVFLVPKEILDAYGPALILAPFILVIIIFIAALAYTNREKRNPLLLQRQKIIEELKEAEKQFLKHKIEKSTFDSISKEKHEELIAVEAQVDMQKKQKLPAADMKKMQGLSNDKKRILTGLLEQKQKKVTELNIAEKNYYKRAIDEVTFRKISSEIQKEIISIEAQINSLQTTEEIEKLREQLKEGAKEISRQISTSKDRNLSDYENDVMSQVEILPQEERHHEERPERQREERPERPSRRRDRR